MKLKFLTAFLLLLTASGLPARPQEAAKPLNKNQVMELVKAGMDSAELADKVRQLGIDFDLTDDYLQALHKAGAQETVIQALRTVRPKPLSRDQVLELVAGHVPSQRAAALVQQRGIDFVPDDEYLQTLHVAGGEEVLLAALRDAGAAVRAELLVMTSPNAEVLIDGESKGHANAQGEFGIKSKPGTHTVKVSLKGKGDFEQKISLVPPQTSRLEARLEDLAGIVVVLTSTGAAVSLDGSSRGTTDASGQLSIPDVAAGSHELRVSAPGKNEYQKSIQVLAGEQFRVNAVLTDAAGTVVVQTSPGAVVFLDNSERGMTNARGQLSVPQVITGSHELRITAPGKKEFRQSVTVVAGQASTIEAALVNIETPPVEVPKPTTLADTTRINPKDGLKYVWIPTGTFMMGCSPGDTECYDDEKPPHQVTITKGFWLGQTPVTVGAYKRFAATTGKTMPKAPWFDRGWSHEQMAVVDVRWDDAQAYCGWAGGRLPTEAEWEYAARAGSTEARYGPIDEVAWDDKNSGGELIHAVGQKRANGFGLYDMLGSVWEWVNDKFDKNYYQSSPLQDPTGPESGHSRVVRGGSWYLVPRVVRASNRVGVSPGDHCHISGFRCVGGMSAP